MALYQLVIEQIKPFVHTLQFYFQGEPTLHPSLPEMISMAHQEGIYTIVSTNAQLLTHELCERLMLSGLSRIIVSIDGISEESYRSYRQGGSLQRALAGLRSLHDAKQQLKAHTHIEWQCLRLKTNEHEWRQIRQQYRLLGADSLIFKTAQLYDYEHGHLLMPSDLRYSRYQPTDGHFALYRPWWKTGFCHRLFTGAVIDTDGNVLPCCFDKAGQYTFGNIQDKTIRQIWFSEQANAFRRAVFTNRESVPICLNCTE